MFSILLGNINSYETSIFKVKTMGQLKKIEKNGNKNRILMALSLLRIRKRI